MEEAQKRRLHTASEGGVLGSPADEHGAVDEGTGEEVRRRLDVLDGNLLRCSGGFEALAKEAEAVLEVQGTPDVPAEHRGPVDEQHAVEFRLRARLEEGLDSKLQGLQRRAGGGGRPGEACVHLAHRVGDDGVKQPLLALEVVVERAARQPSCGDDFLR